MKNSGSQKISDRYATALFSVAGASKLVDAVEKDLKNIQETLLSSEDFCYFLNNPLLNRDAKRKIISALLEKVGVDKLTNQFISLLAAHKRLELLAEIIAIYLKKCASARGEIAAEVISAKAIEAKAEKEIADALGKIYGKKITIKTRTDESLLGGMVVNIGSKQLDGSLAGKLNRLKQSLKAA